MPVSVPKHKHPGCTFWELKQPFSIRVIWWVWGFAYMGYSERAGCSKCGFSAFAGAFMSSWPRATDIVSTKVSGEHPCPRLGLVFGTRVLFKNFTLSRTFLHLHPAPSQLLTSSSQQVVLSHRADVSLWGSRALAGERQTGSSLIACGSAFPLLACVKGRAFTCLLRVMRSNSELLLWASSISSTFPVPWNLANYSTVFSSFQIPNLSPLSCPIHTLSLWNRLTTVLLSTWWVLPRTWEQIVRVTG